ncbi:hypothetical protein JZ751_022887 [Albula glossodonta]|uniref:Uncharacterized protein n=1 Tax=Albula glossodonta TaxID=121402 RepID=A0A8T2PIR9_9TELE|nr:hypothetical protein JZ751_022887 [Albula glossodonta]
MGELIQHGGDHPFQTCKLRGKSGRGGEREMAEGEEGEEKGKKEMEAKGSGEKMLKYTTVKMKSRQRASCQLTAPRWCSPGERCTCNTCRLGLGQGDGAARERDRLRSVAVYWVQLGVFQELVHVTQGNVGRNEDRKFFTEIPNTSSWLNLGTANEREGMFLNTKSKFALCRDGVLENVHSVLDCLSVQAHLQWVNTGRNILGKQVPWLCPEALCERGDLLLTQA